MLIIALGIPPVATDLLSGGSAQESAVLEKDLRGPGASHLAASTHGGRTGGPPRPRPGRARGNSSGLLHFHNTYTL
jgi:hypothetical protein